MFLSEMVASVRGSPSDPLEGEKHVQWRCTPPAGGASLEQARVVLAQAADPAKKRTMSPAREHSSTLVGIPEDVGNLVRRPRTPPTGPRVQQLRTWRVANSRLEKKQDNQK
jgi:hypothetical protein